jgi:hypothetical protein
VGRLLQHAALSFGIKQVYLVLVDKPTGMQPGRYTGWVAIRASGSFNVHGRQSVGWRNCRLLQRADSYDCALRPASLPDHGALLRSPFLSSRT